MSSPFRIEQSFPPNDRPPLQALVLLFLPPVRLGLVPFLVDTGADRTTIGYADRVRLGIPDAYPFVERVQLDGIGGSAIYGVARTASVTFTGTRDGQRSSHSIGAPLLVAENPNDTISLLGRDVLYYFELTLINGLVTLEERPPSAT